MTDVRSGAARDRRQKRDVVAFMDPVVIGANSALTAAETDSPSGAIAGWSTSSARQTSATVAARCQVASRFGAPASSRNRAKS